MAGPNMTPTFYCRAEVVGEAFGGALGRLLSTEGCKMAGPFLREGKHVLCKPCRRLIDPEQPSGKGAWFIMENKTVKQLYEWANAEDEEAWNNWNKSSGSSRPRSRSPILTLTAPQIGSRRVSECSAEQLMLYIRSMP